MEHFRGRIVLIALCFSLNATRVHADDQMTSSQAAGGHLTPVATGAPPSEASSLKNNSGERNADADHWTNASDATADASKGSDSYAGNVIGPPEIAANAEDLSNPSRALDQQDLITMNFQNVNLPVLAKFISEITGKNFVLDENVRGKVSIISPTKVTPEQAYSIFQSVLQIKGFTTLQAGSIIKIIPSRDVRQSAELTQSQQPGLTQGDQYVTRIVKLRHTDATSIISMVQPMMSREGLVAAFPQGNTLIITDDAYNVQRLLRILGSLDV